MVRSRLIRPISDYAISAFFLDPNYPLVRKKLGLPPDEHPGVDYNLKGTSGNQDYGYPVVAIADGVVTWSRWHKVWGNVVKVRHNILARQLGYKIIESQYAHLAFRTVKEGEIILAGEPVGSIGNGDPAYKFLAHLHFEIRTEELPGDYWPKTRDLILKSYLDPEQIFKHHLNPSRTYVRSKGFVQGSDGLPYIVNLDYEDKLYGKVYEL